MKTPTPMTPFDEATASGLRMLKLFLPLFPPATQSMLAVFIKFIELQNVLHHQTPVSYDALSACDFSSGRGIESLFQDNADSIFDHLSPHIRRKTALFYFQKHKRDDVYGRYVYTILFICSTF